ncbi:MAG: hypothetical protein RDU25_05185 [Patescibacteria group bacterium]|nr:hypothetical protein [Patescibacteria group bacterium]
MDTKLIGTWSLIKESWNSFTKTWSQTTKISIWFVYIGFIEFIDLAMVKFAPWMAPTYLLIIILVGVGALWVTIRLILSVLKEEESKSQDEKADQNLAWELILPVVWIALLQTLVLFGAFLLFIIPGIYLMITLSFTQLIAVDQGIKGTKALSASHDLVKGRWFQVLWRLFFGGLALSVPLFVLMIVIYAILGYAVGPNRFLLLIASKNPDPLFSGTMTMVNSVLQAAFVPLFVILQVKLYKALQKIKA